MTKTSFFYRIFSMLLILAFMLAIRPFRSVQADGVLFVKSTASGTGNCSSWANACTLQTALTGAISGDEIWVAAGTHKPTTGIDRTVTFQLKSGVALYGGFAGTETTLGQRNWSDNLTILSGDIGEIDNIYDNSRSVVNGSGTDATAVLDGFTVTGGYSINSGAGGGLINVYGNPTISNIIFTANEVNNYGGGLFNDNSSPTLTNITFNGNISQNAGGGICNYDHSSPIMTNITFSGNNAYHGGGMWNYATSNPVMTNVTFSGNSADEGGGMYSNGSNPSLTNVTFSGNSADLGGGMQCGGSNLSITNVTFIENHAKYGGGMANYSCNTILTNVTFSGNSADFSGGGIYNDAGSTQIHNTILWNNTADVDGSQIFDLNGSSPAVDSSVVQGGYAGGTNIITTDPLLGTPGSYGGYTQTIPLLTGSSAIDTANDTVCPLTDQRGVTRPQGAHSDIGAFEVVNTPPTVNLSGVTSSLPEDTDTSSAIKVADISISDDGIGINGLSLSGTDSTLFEIVGNALRLKAGSSLDFETNAILNVTVEVNDSTISGGPEDTEALAISVTNVNEPPVITSNGGGDTANLSVAENSTAVTTLTATDVDAGSTLTYLISGGVDSARFTINFSSGALTFVSPPNFESPADAGANNVYEVTLRVTDGVLTDSQALTVTVTNINESPVITSNGGGDSANQSVAENSTAVTTLTATDVDAGSSLTYSISGGDDSARFTINPSSGALTFVSPPNFESPADVGANNIYEVTLRVTDGALTDSQALTVTVIDLQEVYLPMIMK